MLTRVMMRPDAELPRQQRRQQVLLVVVDDADEDVAAADVLALEQLEIGAVAIEHERVLEPAGDHLAARRVALDQRDVEAFDVALEPFGQLQPDVAAADDRRRAAGAARRCRSCVAAPR